MLALRISLYDARLRFLERRLRCAPEAEVAGSNPAGRVFAEGPSAAADHADAVRRGGCRSSSGELHLHRWLLAVRERTCDGSPRLLRELHLDPHLVVRGEFAVEALELGLL